MEDKNIIFEIPEIPDVPDIQKNEVPEIQKPEISPEQTQIKELTETIEKMNTLIENYNLLSNPINVNMVILSKLDLILNKLEKYDEKKN